MKSKGKIFLVDDDELIIQILSALLEGEGYEVRTENKDFKNVVDKIAPFLPDAVMLDIKLPRTSGLDILKEIKNRGIEAQIVMLTADDTADTAVRAMKLGAADYLTKPFNNDEVKIVIKNTIEKVRLQHEVEHLRKISCEYFERDLIGESQMIRDLKATIEKMTSVHVSSVLITGESGTGKELIARYIHYLMFGSCKSRCEPFVAVNCAALPDHLLESEFFGHEKGAFTDAKAEKKGVFELANGGSLLLDEIGEMKPNLQSKLLRVLEERTTRRIGGKEDIPIDVTVLATTNRNLVDAVNKGEFRKDLFFRLSTFYLHIPPIRERQEDIPLLARYFLTHYSTRYNKKVIKSFSPEAEKLLISYNWPGNVRELKNLVERLVVLENVEEIPIERMPEWLRSQSITIDSSAERKFILPKTGISLEELEKDLIKQALERSGYNKAIAAKLLDVSYDTIRYQMKKFGME